MRSKISVLIATLIFATQANALSVIVHPSNANALDESTINRIFVGKAKAFPDGSQAVPLNQPESSEATSLFNSKVLNKSSSQLKAYWSKLVFTGKGTPPKEVMSDAEVAQLVASNPNMIGYVTDTAGANVKVVATF